MSMCNTRSDTMGKVVARVLLPLAAIALSGCGLDFEPTGPTEYSSQSIDLGKAESARVEIKMGVGELRVEGGSPKLLDADFTYNVPSWKPVVREHAFGNRSDVTIYQPSDSETFSNARYQWDLRLNNQIPVDVSARFGVGHASLNLGSLDLRSVDIHTGVGHVDLDLRGKPRHDYSVYLTGGVGQATVHLPRDAGIYAEAKHGIGSVTVRGLEREGGRWINPAPDRAAAIIHLDIKSGVGNITLIAE
jgi:hypothetical protein